MFIPRLAPLSLVLSTVDYFNASPLSDAGSAAPHVLVETSCTRPKPCGLARSPACSTREAIDAVLEKYKPSISVFWAGDYGGSSILPKADAYAEKRSSAGASTIGMVLCQDPNIAMPLRGGLWSHASKRFAELARGPVPVALGEVTFDTATFFGTELPALKANKEVTHIFSIDVGTEDCKPICYWHCNGDGGCPQGQQDLPLCTIQTFPPNTPPKGSVRPSV